ncbi:MAG: TadE family protein [Planctomycetota bacterium]
MASRKQRRRKGVEIVELAVSMPLLTVLVFGVLETCEALFLNQSASIAAYESARVAARPDATALMAIDRGDELMTGRRVQGASVEVSPPDIQNAARGTPITITVRAPFGSNRTTGFVLSNNLVIEQSATMVRE